MSLTTGQHAPDEATLPIALPITDRVRRESRAGDVLVGRYRLLDLIGRGGMASVFRARDERLARDVAVKISSRAEDMPAPPLREELVASALIHPNIVAIFDGGEIPAGEPGAGNAFIVMEYVPGTTAGALAPLPWQRAVDVIAQACDGLTAAHARGIVHCDVKPGNILIDDTGRVRIVDFGVAASMESEPAEYVHGSPAYIAPERLRGERPDPRMDVYGLGGVLAYLVTGRHLDGATAPADLPVGCPAGLAEVVERARTADPADRYGDVSQLKHALFHATQPDVETEDRLVASTVQIGPRRDAQATVQVRRPRPLPTSPREHRSGVRLSAEARIWLSSHVSAALVVCVGLLLVALLAPRLVPSSGNPPAAAATTMPDVRAQSLSVAVEQLAQQGLSVERVEVIYGPGPHNQVVAQQPEPGAELNDDEIVLIVRTGS